MSLNALLRVLSDKYGGLFLFFALPQPQNSLQDLLNLRRLKESERGVIYFIRALIGAEQDLASNLARHGLPPDSHGKRVGQLLMSIIDTPLFPHPTAFTVLLYYTVLYILAWQLIAGG